MKDGLDRLIVGSVPRLVSIGVWAVETRWGTRVMMGVGGALFLIILFGLNPNASGFHVDGQFQLLSTSILAGSGGRLGGDHFLYLGIFFPHLMAPFTGLPAGGFVLLGTIFALCGWALLAVLLARHLLASAGSAHQLLAALIAFALVVVADQLIFDFRVFYLDHSALALRFVWTAAGFMGVAVLIGEATKRPIRVGVLIGLMPLLSFDYGIPLGAAAGLMVLLRQWRTPGPVAVSGAVAVVMPLLAVLILSGFDPAPFIARALETSAGQFWYFGSYDEKLFTPLDAMGRLGSLLFSVPGLIAVLVAIFSRSLPLRILLGALVVAGLLLEGAGHMAIRYHYPWMSVAMVAGGILVWRGVCAVLVKGPLAEARAREGLLALGAAVSLLVTAGLLSGAAVRQVGFLLSPASNYDAQVSDVMSEAVEERAAWGRLVGDYYTPAAHLFQGQIDTPTGLALHALGPTLQEDWLAALSGAKTAAVLTTHPGYTPWFYWSRQQQHWFFDAVLRLYRPAVADSRLILWDRRAEPLRWQPTGTPCEIAEDEGAATVTLSFAGSEAVQLRRVRFTPTANGAYRLWKMTPSGPDGAPLDFGAPMDTEQVAAFLPPEPSELTVTAVRAQKDTIVTVTACVIETLAGADPGALFDPAYEGGHSPMGETVLKATMNVTRGEG